MSEKKLELIRKAKFNLEISINLLDRAGNSLQEGKELVMLERTISDLKYAKLRLSDLLQNIVERVKLSNL